MSLLHRLLLLVFLALLPAGAIEIDNEMQLRTAREAEVRQGVLQLAGMFAGEQERLVDGVRQVLHSVAQTEVVRRGLEQVGDTSRCQSYLERLRTGLPMYLRVRLAGRDGIQRCATEAGAVGVPVGDGPHVREALDGRFAVGEHFRLPDEQASFLPLALPVRDDAGTVPGIVTGMIDLGWLTRHLSMRPLPDDAGILLFDRAGSVVVRVPAVPAGANPQPDATFRRQLASLDKPAVIERPDRFGTPRIYGVAPISGAAGLGVAVSIERNKAIGPIERKMTESLALVCAVMVATLLAAWWGGDRFIRGPAMALVDVAERWRAGDLSARTGLAAGKSEIGTIGRAFDAMAEELQRQAAMRDSANALAHKAAAVLSTTNDGVFEVDRSWRITFMNERARELLGAERNLTGHRLTDAFPEAKRSIFAKRFRHAIQAMTAVSFEAYYPGQSAWYAVRAFPSPDGLAVFFQDITQLRLAEAARRRSEARFRAVFEMAAVGIERLALDGRYLDVNAKLCAILGYRREELLSRNFADLTHPDDLVPEQAILDRLLSGEIPSYAVEKRYHRRDGHPVWVRVTSSLARADGETSRISIVEDITERKLIEQDFRAATEEAERANLAKSKFLAASSHDLRQPLQSLFFFSAALGPHVAEGRGREMLRHLDQGLDALKGLLDSLLDVSRLDSGAVTPTMEDFQASDLTDAIDAAYAPLAAERRLRWMVEGCDIAIRSDRTLLARMIRNLVENALRYTKDGLVRVRCRRDGGRVAIEVQDTGIGIPPGHLERIFEEFHQVGNPERDRNQGLGLGLAIVRRLSRLLDHPVEVRSVEGQGSAFRILVPCGSVRYAANDPVPGRPDDGQGRFAVLVDDDAIVLMGLSTILGDWGYSVLAADSADQALDRLAGQERVPDIVIADYRLREGRVGTEVVRKVRERYGRPVPGVILTGETGADCLHDAAAHGVPVIHKPVTPRQLSAAVERQLKAAV